MVTWKKLGFVMGLTGILALVPALASAQGCGEVSISPDPGWLGGQITINGTGFTPGSEIFVNFGGTQIGSTFSNADGAFSLGYTIPNDFPDGETNVFAQDGPANCEDNPSFVVNRTPPTPTTTIAESTTSEAPDPTAAPTVTTTAAPGTSAATTLGGPTGDTSSTTDAPQPDSGGLPTGLLLVLLGIVAAAMVWVGVVLSRQNSGDREEPPA